MANEVELDSIGRRKRQPGQVKFKSSKRSQGKRTISAASARLKELWQTPEFRERMRVRNENTKLLRSQDPTRFNRNGVPNGMRKRDALPLWKKASELADRFIKVMEDTNQVDVIVVPDSDEEKGKEALREAFKMAVGPSTQNIKIQAINTVLAYTKSKPESKSKLTLDKAEDFLAAVAEDLK